MSSILDTHELPPQKQQDMAAAIHVARAECLGISKMMHKKLPSELRDLIYSYLCLEDRQVPIGPYYHFRTYKPHANNEPAYSDTQYFPRTGDLQTDLGDGQTRIDHDLHPQDGLLLPQNYIFDPSYMSEEVVLETLKTYYKNNSFSVCNIEGGLDDLCSAVRLGADGLATDFVPIDHIHDLQIRVKFEHFHEGAKVIGPHTNDRLKQFTEEELLLRYTVESLQRFRSRMLSSTPHQLEIEVVLISNLSRDRVYSEEMLLGSVVNYLQTVRNMVYELIHDRDHTTVRVTHVDDTLMSFPKNYTGLFKLTKEQWDYEKARQQPNHDWSQDFWVIPVPSKDIHNPGTLGLGGYCCDSLGDFQSMRWGVKDIFRERTSSISVVEGSYWPRGRPYHPHVAQALIEKSPSEFIVED
ncbi:hypothetical protein C7974DRAFT_394774 [Boeremia exigua]|uniref:uncharacterized protein n=1 Tax=Boeremia exigua TaxID=749465 RepID=UPI001E8DC673|nr:uncharacterized protein C7974DRAFT_394774 [Boeremia exigua]KAH6629601.1 hypothetical protein C7974DRAFT_394774 [Boeremia exigua]